MRYMAFGAIAGGWMIFNQRKEMFLAVDTLNENILRQLPNFEPQTDRFKPEPLPEGYDLIFPDEASERPLEDKFDEFKASTSVISMFASALLSFCSCAFQRRSQKKVHSEIQQCSPLCLLLHYRRRRRGRMSAIPIPIHLCINTMYRKTKSEGLTKRSVESSAKNRPEHRDRLQAWLHRT